MFNWVKHDDFDKRFKNIEEKFEQKFLKYKEQKDNEFKTKIEELKQELMAQKKINEIFLEKIKKQEEKNDIFVHQFEKEQKDISNLRKKVKYLLSIAKEIAIGAAEETETINMDLSESEKRIFEKRNSDLKTFNKNINYLNNKIKTLETTTNKKFDALMEAVAEKLTDEDKILDIFGQKNVREILNKFKNKDRALLASLVYLFHKNMSMQGIRV